MLNKVKRFSLQNGVFKRLHSEADFQDVHNRLLRIYATQQAANLRLIDDSHHVQARNGSGVLGRLPLGVAKVGGHGDHGVRDRFTQVRLGGLLHLEQDHGADLFGGVILKNGSGGGQVLEGFIL